ncbi:hypothetical protein BKA70DRAFT_2812 [Coprinopsis sp. MPI-PUGE-AT-0042]|nr:hypothetical protein BKA70DRAFT_2812 [Coprinopsis sp. MPI-PUGE-AT-0042]
MVWYHEPSNGPSVRGKPLRKESLNAAQCLTPPSQQCSPLASPVSPVDCYGHQEAKSMLSSLLAHGRLPSMPPTFPFYPVRNQTGTISQLPYEFRQDLCIPQGSSWATQTATISFNTDGKQYVWRVSLPTVGSYQGSRSTPTVVAEVRMDTSIERNGAWYFNMLASESQLISKALATSLENGVQIIITQADNAFVTYLRNSRPPVRSVTLGDIIYTSRNTAGEAQIIQVLGGETRQSKYSALVSIS